MPKQRLNERIDDQAAEPLEKANKQYVEKYQRPFTERKLFPELLRFSTTERRFAWSALQAGGGKLAAPGLPPPVVEGADMTLRLHESAINNLAFDALAGRTVYEEKVQAAVTDAAGPSAREDEGRRRRQALGDHFRRAAADLGQLCRRRLQGHDSRRQVLQGQRAPTRP